MTLQNFQTVLLPQSGAQFSTSVQAQRVPLSVFNSFAVGASVSLICVALGTFAGYAFARFGKARFLRVSLWALLLTRMTPALTLVLPFFIVLPHPRAHRHANRPHHRLFVVPAAAQRLDDDAAISKACPRASTARR